MHKLLSSRGMNGQSSDKADFAILPRRKAGQGNSNDKKAQPISISKALLENYFHMSLNQASKELGICATAIKKVCRKLGILKWPFRDRNVTAKGLLTDKNSEVDCKIENDDAASSISTRSGKSVSSNPSNCSSAPTLTVSRPRDSISSGCDADTIDTSEEQVLNSSNASVTSHSDRGDCDRAGGLCAGTESGCEPALLHPGEGDEEGDVILSDSTTDCSDTDAPPFILPSGFWEIRYPPRWSTRASADDEVATADASAADPLESDSASMYRRLLFRPPIPVGARARARAGASAASTTLEGAEGRWYSWAVAARARSDSLMHCGKGDEDATPQPGEPVDDAVAVGGGEPEEEPAAADWALADACLNDGDLADDEDDEAAATVPRRVPPAAQSVKTEPDAVVVLGEDNAPKDMGEEVGMSFDGADTAEMAAAAATAAQAAAAEALALPVSPCPALEAASPAKTDAMCCGTPTEAGSLVKPEAEGEEEREAAVGTNIFKYMSYQTACDPAARRRVLKSLAASLADGATTDWGAAKRARTASPPPPGRYPLTSAELLFLAAGSSAAAVAAKAAALPGSGA